MIRGATAADYEGFATLFRELGDPGPTPSPHRWTTDLVRSTLVADRDGTVAGYIDFYALSEVGHVRNLVVAPAARNTGVGADLMRAAAERLRAHGIREWHLNVKHDNTPAVRLYEKLGMQVEHRSTVFRVPWAIADALPHDPATASDVSPADDDDIERALGLLSGRIAMLRRSRGILIQLRGDDLAAVGFAAFARGIGASPFRVARPALVGSLLAAIRSHAEGAPHVEIVLEDCPPCSRLLARAGAEVRLELLHYRGSLG